MKRRDFLKAIGVGSLATTFTPGFNLYAAPEDYNGKLLLSLQAGGGWDVTSFCDPKMNLTGESVINNWANKSDIKSAGNIAYAPFANNAEFFETHYQDMLVINGIDVQANSHDTGIIHSYSGRLQSGFPTLTALFASVQAPQLSLSYLNHAGTFSDTAKLVRGSRFPEPQHLGNIISPNQVNNGKNEQWLPSEDWANIQAARKARMQLLQEESGQTLRQTQNRLFYQQAINNSRRLSDLDRTIKAQHRIYDNTPDKRLRRQAQLSLLAMSAGVTCAADIRQSGFDSHFDNDIDQTRAFNRVTDGVGFIWRLAEKLDLADRLILLISSDMGRTPWYNSKQGKDHWPVTSTVIMERNQRWTNRTIGLTDEGHYTVAIDPRTHRPSELGSVIYPKHVMQELRDYLGISQHENATSFELNAGAEFGFFKS